MHRYPGNFYRSVKHGELLSSIKLTDTRGHNCIPITPGVQGAVLRGKTALVLTHSNGVFTWCVSFIISWFCCMVDPK